MTYQVSALQSLLQLSIALNLGFLGFTSLSGDKLEREESLLNDLIILTEALSTKAPLNNEVVSECNRISTACLHLKDRYKSAQAEIEQFTRGRYRIAVVISAALSFIGLTLTSYLDTPLTFITFIASVILYIPFIVVLIQRYRTTARHSSEISEKRSKLDIELANVRIALANRA